MLVSRLALVSSLLGGAAAANAQEFIHYKFDGGCMNDVINYANGPSAFPAAGVLESTSASSPWVPGVFGEGLAGGSTAAPTYYNRVRTGWDPSVTNITGDLTMAWFTRLRTGAVGTTYLMGNTGGFRLFSTGIAGRGLYQRTILATGGNGINATPLQDFYLPATVTDFQTLAAAGWVHVGIVVDATAQTADWYINGTSVLSLSNIVGGALINAAGDFTLGQWSSSTSNYEMDEFFMARRALSAVEMLALSTASRAGDGGYSSGIASQCGTASLSSTGGRPALGNSGYGLVLNSTNVGAYVMVLGATRCTAAGGAIKLPLGPIGPGQPCWLLADPLLTLSGNAPGTPVTIPLGVPNSAALAGVGLYSQAVILDSTVLPQLIMTRGWSMGLGF